jgi:hypothetical protein
MKSESRLEKTIPLLLGMLLTLFIVLLIHRDFPYVGDDYRYFVPRLIDTNLHIQLNGLSIQWYTPSFGGGLPAYPNPQNLEYSFVQWASYFLGPWTGILVTTAVISLLGYYFFYRLLEEKIGLGWKASTLGALFFLGNGFYIEHMIIGHLGYQLFPLGALILFLLLDTKNRLITNAILIALLLTMMIHQAGFYLIVILALSSAIALVILYLARPQLIELQRIVLTAALGVILAVLISSSKIFATFSLMQQFPRRITDVYDVGIFQAIIGLLAQFFGVMSLAPLLFLGGINTDFLSGALSHVTGALYGIWETDISISPVLIAFLFTEFAHVLANLRSRNKNKIESSKVLASLLLFFLLSFSIELTLAKGLLFSLVKDLPIINSLHVNVRFASVFILPLVMWGAFVMERYFQQKKDIRVFITLCLLTFATLSTYFFLSGEIHSRSFTMSPSLSIQRGESYNITQIKEVRDWQVFVEQASSYRTYEPLFGYKLENFIPATRPGSVFDEDNGYFNMTNPAGFVFPRLNNTRPFERFKRSERDKLELFLRRGQPHWQIPTTQILFNYLSLISLVICLIWLLVNWVSIVSIKRKLLLPDS